MSEAERLWMSRGYRLLPNTSSATLSWYAKACAERPGWRQDCEQRPELVLRRLGFAPDD